MNVFKSFWQWLRPTGESISNTSHEEYSLSPEERKILGPKNAALLEEMQRNWETRQALMKDPQTAKYLPTFNKYAGIRERIAREGREKPVPQNGEIPCIECHGYGILREVGERRPTLGGGYDFNLKCDFCGQVEPMHKMAPWEIELSAKVISNTIRGEHPEWKSPPTTSPRDSSESKKSEE